MRFCYSCEKSDTPECEFCHMKGYGVEGDLEYLVLKSKGGLNEKLYRMGKEVPRKPVFPKVSGLGGGYRPLLF
jgi:hypothetical protein